MPRVSETGDKEVHNASYDITLPTKHFFTFAYVSIYKCAYMEAGD